MKTFLKVLAVLGVISLFGGLAWHFKVQASRLQNMCFNMAGYRIEKASTFKKIVLTMILRLKNPSDIDITVDSYDLNIFVNKRKVADLKRNFKKEKRIKKRKIFKSNLSKERKKALIEKIKNIGKIKRNGFSDLELTFSFEPKNIFNSILDADVLKGILLREKKTKIKIKGYITASHGKLFTVSNIPIDIEMPLADMIPIPGEEEPPCI